MVPKPAPALLSERGASAPDRRRLALLALGHAVTDSYGASFLSPIFPLLAARLGLNMAMVGSLPMVMGLSGSLGQPVLGYLSDRRSRLCLVALGPAVACTSSSAASSDRPSRSTICRVSRRRRVASPSWPRRRARWARRSAR